MSGPWRVVRRYSYLSNLMCLASWALALSSCAGPGLTLFVVSLIARCLEREEDMLTAQLGQRYEHYRQQAHWRRIPRVF